MMACRCGRHLPVKDTLLETVKQCKDGEKLCQCFLGGPQRYDTRNIPKDDALATREYLASRDMKLYVHSPYVINLAREGDDSIVEKSKQSLQKVISSLYKIGPEYTGTVFHIGAKGTLENVARSLNDMEILVPTFCENSAGEGSKLGKNIDELRRLIEATDSHLVGVTIDTCHSFAAGMTDFREMSAVEKLFEDLSFLDNRPLSFHLNDSLTDFGGCSDRHSPIGYAKIWNVNHPQTLDTLVRFYELAKSNCNDIIYETPNDVTDKLENDMFHSI